MKMPTYLLLALAVAMSTPGAAFVATKTSHCLGYSRPAALRSAVGVSRMPRSRPTWSSPVCELVDNFQSSVRQLHSLDNFRMLKSQSRISIVALAASHCRKCHAVAGKFNAVAKEYETDQDVVFATVQLDKVRGVAQEAGVSKTPTFHVYMNGEKVDELVGNEEASVVASKIKYLVEQWSKQPEIMADDLEASKIVSSYTPTQDDTSMSGGSDKTAAMSESVAGAEGGADCGDDGCEIKWD